MLLLNRITDKFSDGTPFIPYHKIQSLGKDGIAKIISDYEDSIEKDLTNLDIFVKDLLEYIKNNKEDITENIKFQDGSDNYSSNEMIDVEELVKWITDKTKTVE